MKALKRNDGGDLDMGGQEESDVYSTSPEPGRASGGPLGRNCRDGLRSLNSRIEVP